MIKGKPSFDAASELEMLAAEKLHDAAGQVDRKKNGETARRYFGAASRLLKAYADPNNFHEGRPINTLPPGAALRISGLFDYLESGIVPAPIKDSARRGNILGPTAESDVGKAVEYVLAAREGIVPDRSPIKTVCESFGCANRKTVHDWIKQHVDRATPGSKSSRLELGADAIIQEMQRAAARYSVAGPGTKAIGIRNLKKR